MQRTKNVLAVVGAAVVLIVGFDSVTFAATGSSLILGHSNSADRTTTVTNTGSGAVLRLKTSNPAAPPFTTNATGTVKNLKAAKAAHADNATNATNATTAANAQLLQGQTASQVVGTARQGLFSQVINRDALHSLNAGDNFTLDSYCNAGETAVGGAVNLIPDGTGTVITSRPDGDTFGDSPDNGSALIGWRGVVHADSSALLVVHVFCAS